VDRGAIDAAPEFHRLRMQTPPCLLITVLIVFARSVVVWRQTIPCARAAHISEGEIGGFAARARGLFPPAAAATRQIIRFVLRIAGAIEFRPLIELGLLSRDPRQQPAFNAAEIAYEQLVSRRRADHRPGDVTDSLKRLLIKLLNMGQVAGRDRDPLRL